MTTSLNILGSMGGTPVHEITARSILKTGSARLFIKLEEFNPGESIKARVALNMVLEAERTGRLTPASGQTLIEPTGGNTGAGLALVAAQRGYALRLVVPDNYVSPARLKLLRLRGAQISTVDHKLGNDAHYREVEKLARDNPDYVWLDQFTNPANPATHYMNTGPEILKRIPRIDAFVAGIGSGGTISGVGRYLRENIPAVEIIGVQPDGCDTLRGKSIPHLIQGFAVGMLPRVLDGSLVSRMESVSYEDAISTAKILARTEGILVGISSGANIVAAVRTAERLGKDQVVVTICPDSGKNYPDVFLV